MAAPIVSYFPLPPLPDSLATQDQAPQKSIAHEIASAVQPTFSPLGSISEKAPQKPAPRSVKTILVDAIVIPLNRAESQLHQLFVRFNQKDGRLKQVRLLDVRLLFSMTAIVYKSTKILLLNTLLVRSVYKIIKLLKKFFFFTDGDTKINGKALLHHQSARHTLLKLANNSVKVISGGFDLLTQNELTRMTYAALGLGSNFQLFSEGVIQTFDAIMTPLSLLKIGVKTSALYLSIRKVQGLESHSPSENRWAAYLVLGRTSLDFGLESLRWGLFLSGISTGAYGIMVTLAALGIVSSSIGLVKHFLPIKALSETAVPSPIVLPKSSPAA